MNRTIILCASSDRLTLTALKTELQSHFGDRDAIETVVSGEVAMERIKTFKARGEDCR